MSADKVLVMTDAEITQQARRLWTLAQGMMQRRFLLGIAGVPGSGKSTLAEKVTQAVNAAAGAAVARLAPMDGFHLRNAELEARGLRPFKGSPATFDARAYAGLLRSLRERESGGGPVYFPVYDRGLHEPALREVPAQCVDEDVRVIVTEGNYLLLRDEPWDGLADVFDETWMLETDPQRAKEWIVQRHQRGGRSAEDARQHYERNDLPNTQAVMARSRAPTRRVRWG